VGFCDPYDSTLLKIAPVGIKSDQRSCSQQPAPSQREVLLHVNIMSGRVVGYRMRSQRILLQPRAPIYRYGYRLPTVNCRGYHGKYSPMPTHRRSDLTCSSAAAPPPGTLRRGISLGASGVAFAVLGCLAALGPLVWRYRQATVTGPTDEESLHLYVPEDEKSKEVEDFIQSHPLVLELRANPDLVESRPHMKIPEFWKKHNLTGSTLLGPGRIVVPPLSWNEKGGKSMVSVVYLGSDLCGHPGVVHGGLLATMLDEGFARCCFAALPHQVGVTAHLEINYRKPAKADTYVVLRAKTTKVEGRKAWVEGRIETLTRPGETPTVLAEASALFISPKFAKASPQHIEMDCSVPADRTRSGCPRYTLVLRTRAQSLDNQHTAKLDINE